MKSYVLNKNSRYLDYYTFLFTKILVILFFLYSPILLSENVRYGQKDYSQKHIIMVLGKGTPQCQIVNIDNKQVDKGNCFGFSSVWLCSKWLQFSYPEKYQINWYNYTVNDILGNFSDCDNIKKFTLYIEKFQHSQQDGNFENLVNQLLAGDGKIIHREYSIASLFTLKQAKQLIKENIIHNHKLVFLNTPSHATVLFKDQGSYYYFDPNDYIGERQTHSMENVIDFIFESNGFYSIEPAPIALQIFSLDEEETIYPTQESILDRIKPSVIHGYNDYLNKTTGLHQAATSGCLESATYFLNIGLDINSLNEQGFSALMLASLNGYHKVVQWLLERGASYDLSNNYGYTALMFASKNGHFEIVQLLLKKKANPNLVSKNGYTALMIASQNGHDRVIELLLENGANPDLVDRYSYNAFKYAIRNGHNRAAWLLLDNKNSMRQECLNPYYVTEES